MANRRYEMFEIRQILVQMRLGAADREIAMQGLMGRKKLSQVRRTAKSQGWLDNATPLPENDVLAKELDHAVPIQPPQSLVQPYATQVLAWQNQGIQGTTIHQALVRKFGFTGAYNSVKRFLSRHQKPQADATVILDFEPGDAAQVDFGSGPVIVDPQTGEVRRTWFFAMTLAWSRHQYAEFVLDQTVDTWLGCHRRAFEFFNGVPGRVIIDNPKCAITKACYYDPDVQRSYAEIAEGYGFRISACPPRDPKKKGIIESGVKYIKNNFVPLREFHDLADANRQLMEWILETAGNRIHGTTRERPLTRFAETERHFLTRLPDIAPEIATWARVKVHGNCHVQFVKSFYSVPFALVHQHLHLRAGEKTVQVFDKHLLVAVHPRLRRPGQKSTVDDHQPPEAQAYLMRDPQWCIAKAERTGPMCRELVDRLFSHKVLDNLRAVQGVLKLADRFGSKRLEQACGRALEHDTPLYRAVKSILEKGLDQAPATTQVELPLPPVYRGHSRFSRTHSAPLQ